ncbi:MAG: hypothetical protein ABSE48_12370 [Verrucomicrobiota bacterium]|jgi:hypothetical protein
MKQTKIRWKSILWLEGFGFSIIIGLSWLTEMVRIPHLLFGEAFTPNWHRAILRTIVVLLVWVWVHLATSRLLKRLHYLENFLLICGWCRRVCDHDEWMTMEKYFDAKFQMHTSHGMCPDCVRNELKSAGEKKTGGPNMFK